jgi:hypothetical protein
MAPSHRAASLSLPHFFAIMGLMIILISNGDGIQSRDAAIEKSPRVSAKLSAVQRLAESGEACLAPDPTTDESSRKCLRKVCAPLTSMHYLPVAHE